MNTNLELAFEKTIRECLELGRPFSAYNITILTRQREHLKLRHQDCLGTVHDLEIVQDALDYGFTMQDGQTLTWSRSTFTNWAGPSFEVYHPLGYDLNNFVPEGVGPASPTEIQASVRPLSMIGQVTPQNDGSQPDAGGHNTDGTFRTDFRQRLLVPTKFMREAGITAGDSVHVFANPTNNIIWISKDQSVGQNQMTVITIQTVERNGDIRLSSRTLKAADFAKNTFVIESSEKDCSGRNIKVVEITQA
jgi:bifunctional DNA-binding transcriptional regulator/antitoxin component of YhaV-PrlF toxin-antitoxin module